MSLGISKKERLWLYTLHAIGIVEYGTEVTYNWNGKKKTVKCSLKTKKNERLI